MRWSAYESKHKERLMSTHWIFSALVAVSVLANATIADEVRVTSDVGSVESSFDVGDTVTIGLFVDSDGDTGVFGVDLELATASPDLRIRAIEFAEPFTETRIHRNAMLPAHRFRAVRTQPARDADRSLGARGQEVPLATVEMEILAGSGFHSALLVGARGLFLGDVPDHTMVLGRRSERHRAGRGRFEIVNLKPGDRDPSTVSFELREAGAESPVEFPAAHQLYEVHYTTNGEELNGFALYAVARTPRCGFATARAPSHGPWADSGRFEFFDADARGVEPLPAPGHPDGFLRCQVAHTNLKAAGDRRAGSSGHLCTITTGDPGELILELEVWLLSGVESRSARSSIMYEVR
jgi:hypothetical protein